MKTTLRPVDVPFVGTAPLTLAVAAAGHAEAASGRVADLRTDLSSGGWPALPASLLKHAAAQTLLGLAAVRRALADSALRPDEFAAWGAVGSPRNPGRLWMLSQLGRFAAEGAWGVSPHGVPHCSLHSLSGMLSQALGLHGPNLGVGGRRGLEGQAVGVAAALLAGGRLPGVWVVWSGWQPEPVPESADPPVCRAAALALRPADAEAIPSRMRLTLTPPQPTPPGLRYAAPEDGADAGERVRPFTLEGLVAALSAGPDAGRRAWLIEGSGRVELAAA